MRKQRTCMKEIEVVWSDAKQLGLHIQLLSNSFAIRKTSTLVLEEVKNFLISSEVGSLNRFINFTSWLVLRTIDTVFQSTTRRHSRRRVACIVGRKSTIIRARNEFVALGLQSRTLFSVNLQMSNEWTLNYRYSSNDEDKKREHAYL